MLSLVVRSYWLVLGEEKYLVLSCWCLGLYLLSDCWLIY